MVLASAALLAPVTAVAAPVRNGVNIDARIVSIDLTRKSLVLRLEYELVGSFAINAGTPSRDLTLLVNNVSGDIARTYRRGRVMEPLTVTLGIDGDVSDYPFDSFSSGLVVYMTTGPGNLAAGVVGSLKPVPVQVKLVTGYAGFSINSRKPEPQPFGLAVGLRFSRSTPTILYTVFMMVVMWSVGLGAFALSASLVARRRRFEAGFTGFLAALLFAFPAVRNSLPGAPSIGVLTDYAAFFWGEALVAAALLLLLVGWTRRQLVGNMPADVPGHGTR